ncbi:hypothetical protein LCGC14_0942260 [marine sediment metagenome]|uniref:Uncharacterized protein n=1 Tax=marine sediment metagenome TaxID=412755 RepID=A0A0F9P5V9_9ZZZZ
MPTTETMCRRCGIEDATKDCPSCGDPLCDDCHKADACGSVLCVACGGEINRDWDTVFADIGGGIHARCR